MLDVLILTSGHVLFEGQAKSVILPGEQGTFEICPFHKPIVSRLLPGEAIVDKNFYPIKHGVVKVSKNKVTVIVREEGEGDGA